MVYEAYNLSLAGNSTGIVPFMQTVNTSLMFGNLGLLLLTTIVGILFISFMVSTSNDTPKAAGGALFIGFIISLLLRIMGLVDNLAVFATLILAAAALVVQRGR